MRGAFGTRAELLRAGKPSVATPFAFDQFDSTPRIGDVGCGAGCADRPL
jgi:UDP:flavonoid glycosyltransferase YjiC (YdhE family)